MIESWITDATFGGPGAGPPARTGRSIGCVDIPEGLREARRREHEEAEKFRCEGVDVNMSVQSRKGRKAQTRYVVKEGGGAQDESN